MLHSELESFIWGIRIVHSKLEWFITNQNHSTQLELFTEIRIGDYRIDLRIDVWGTIFWKLLTAVAKSNCPAIKIVSSKQYQVINFISYASCTDMLCLCSDIGLVQRPVYKHAYTWMSKSLGAHSRFIALPHDLNARHDARILRLRCICVILFQSFTQSIKIYCF